MSRENEKSHLAARELIDQLPQTLPAGIESVDFSSLRRRLEMLEKQHITLVIARWLYDHQDDMSHVAFAMAVNDERVTIDNDEVFVEDDFEDHEGLIQDVVWLQEKLDELSDDIVESFLDRVIKDLNKVGWNMPEAWHVLEQHAPTGGKISGVDWLGEHRAHWGAVDLQSKVVPVPARSPSPVPRM